MNRFWDWLFEIIVINVYYSFCRNYISIVLFNLNYDKNAMETLYTLCIKPIITCFLIIKIVKGTDGPD